MKYASSMNLLTAHTALILALGLGASAAHSALTDIAPSPVATSATAVVKPNLMFILDDSGSMNRNYMPDSVYEESACKTTGSSLTDCRFADPPYNSSAFNTIYYNPAITYTPAVNYDGTSRPSYTSPWTSVPEDAYGIQSTDIVNLTSAYDDYLWCTTSSPSSTDRTPPFASGVCKRAIEGGVWTYPNATYNRKVAVTGNPYYYTISSVTWCDNANASGFGTTTASPATGTTGTCQAKKIAAFRFPKYGTTGSNGFSRIDIVSTTTTYPRAGSRTDCTGAVGPTGCTYAEEMTNFANWHAYYRTRMQMMKTASGLAFKQVTDIFRVGFITINPGNPVQASKFLAMSDFTAGAGAQKNNWYTKFYAQSPGSSTPLREALSRVGRYYAKVQTGINNGISDDPMQYSCQQNFALLSTDGFWNGNEGQKLDGSDVGNQDNNPVTVKRPQLDGAGDRTDATTTVTRNQAICTGNATVFGATPCGCTGANANMSRVKESTLTSTLTVISRNGVQLSSSTSSSTNYPDITGCSAIVTTTITPVTVVEEQLVAGNNPSTFASVNGVSAGANQNGSCGTNGQARIKQRTTNYNQTVVTTGGVAAAPTFSGTAYTFSDVGSCTAVTTVENYSVSETTRYVAGEHTSGGSDPTAFTAAANGANPQSNYSCSGSGTRTIILERTVGYNKTVTTDSAGTSFTTFPGGSTLTSGPTYVLNNTCSTSAKSTSNTITPTLISTTITGGPAPAATTTTLGTPSATSTGATITSADFTIAPVTSPTTAGPASTAPTTTTSYGTLGYSDTLADVAQYYYMTDLRAPGSLGAAVGSPVAVQLDVGTVNNVKGKVSDDPEDDTANWQHMTTFTLGLGVDGTLTYDPNYRTSDSGDFQAIRNGTQVWPQPVEDTPTAVDDLWHAAANGRGTYFSARDPSQLSAGLTNALLDIGAVEASAAAAATSNLEPVPGDNFAYVASYETLRWNGEVEARLINLQDGSLSTTEIWSAQDRLDALTYSTTPGGSARRILRLNPSSNALEDFTWGNLTATEKSFFGAAWIGSGSMPYPAAFPPLPTLLTTPTITPLSHWGTLDATQQTAAEGSNLISFLRGDSTFESQVSVPAANRLYRDRQRVLGDVINGAPIFVKKISANYADAGYKYPDGANFKECINVGGSGCAGIYNGARDLSVTGVVGNPRVSTVYIAANDGMLHALDGVTGNERWAFVPRIVIPKLFKLADRDYANTHQYYVDGSPTVGDIYDPVAGKWKTILVGGLGAGGRGFYALDVTDPVNPIGLWEFNARPLASCPSSTMLDSDKDDCDLGLSYGNPIITKLGDGTWVVVVTSGYNNVSPGDGKGYVYVLNPITGVIRKKIQAMNLFQTLNPGNNNVPTPTPAGLARINNWVDDTDVNNTTLRVYGGDLLGNMWRFDLDAGTAYSIGRLTDPSGVAQPITVKPELGEVNGVAMVYVGTGRLLGVSDAATVQVQTIWGIKDTTGGIAPAGGASLNVRTGSVAQTLTLSADGNSRTGSSNPVNLTLAGVKGWRVDLPQSKERVNIDLKLQLGTLIVGSNIPESSACTAGGTGWINYFDYKTGGYIQTANNTVVSMKVGNAMIVGIAVVRLPGDKVVAIITTSDNKYPSVAPPFSVPGLTGKRSTWRELP
jgi:type IV pilus assembly protein PilY1